MNEVEVVYRGEPPAREYIEDGKFFPNAQL